MEIYTPTLSAILFLAFFFIVYEIMLIKHTIKYTVDFYDLLLLSSAAIVPFLFVLFPGAVVAVTRFVGVAFPFLILFGTLFIIVFVYLYRLVVRVNALFHRCIVLTQELGILEQKTINRSGDSSRERKDRPTH
jgi:hypothetical protein